MPRLQAVKARAVVLTILNEIARVSDGGPIIRFSKAEFIKAYWRLRREQKVPPVKIETLLRTLRKIAADTSVLYLNYDERSKGKYILDIGAIP